MPVRVQMAKKGLTTVESGARVQPCSFLSRAETHYPNFDVASGCLLSFLDSDRDHKFLTAM